MIRAITNSELPECLEVIHKSFATVAEDFGLTRENCPSHTSFMDMGKLQWEYDSGAQMFGLYLDGLLIGFFALSKVDEDAYKLKHLAVLPEYRYNGYGRSMLDFAKARAKEYGAGKLQLGMIDESSLLKNWYLANSFRITGVQKFDSLLFTVCYMECDL